MLRRTGSRTFMRDLLGRGGLQEALATFAREDCHHALLPLLALVRKARAAALCLRLRLHLRNKPVLVVPVRCEDAFITG